MDWTLKVQVLTDVLLGGHPLIGEGTKQRVPLYGCNSDLTYMTTFHRPRFTQGAFLQAFATLFHAYTGNALEIEMCGKPFSVQYRYAEELLRAEASRIGYGDPEIFVGIGDNPRADIKGANNAGDNWRSVLVKTGVHERDENCEENSADLFVENVEEAIDELYKGNRIRSKSDYNRGNRYGANESFWSQR